MTWMRPQDDRRRAGRSVAIITAGTLGLIGVGVALRAVTAGLGGWDLRTVTAVARWRGSDAVTVARVASLFGRTWVLLPVAVALGAARRPTRGAWLPVCAVVIADVTQNAVKAIVRRPRPPVVHLEHVASWSFPSGHATESSAFLAAMVIALWPRITSSRARAGMVGLALAATALIAAARVVLGVHYPTDVLVGLVLGAAAAPAGLLSRARSPNRVAPRRGAP